MRALLTVPSARTQATVWPFLSVPLKTRSSARRPRNGLESRLVTHACSGASSSYVGAGHVLEDRLEQRLEVVVVGQAAVLGPVAGCGAGAAARRRRRARRAARRRRGRARRRRGRSRGRAAGRGLFLDLVDARVGAVGLVDEQDDGKLRLERLAQHEAGLRQRALARVDEQHDAVDHRQAALDLAAEVGVTGGVDDVDRDGTVGRVHARVGDRRVLGEDRDALLALEIVRVHRALFHVLVRAERVGLAEHGVDERRLAVVDVGDDRDVAEVRTEGARHERILARVGRRPEPGCTQSTGRS